MVFSDTLNELYHLPVVDFPGMGEDDGPPAAEEVAWRVSAGGPYGEVKWPDAFARFRSAVAAASAPVVARLEVLDLSTGTPGDEGAAALLAGQPLTHLRKLDPHHHCIGEELQERMRRTIAVEGVDVDLSEDRTEDDEDEDGTVARSVATGE